jgi:Methyltransferase domain/Glycosyl transferase family 2
MANDQNLKIHAITMIRNEADIILPFLNQAAALFDKLVIVDVQSTDGTLETIRSFCEFWPSIDLYSSDAQEKYQAVMMNTLAAKAFSHGADWVFLLDGDEFINVNGKEEFQNYLRAFPYDVMAMPWVNLVPSRYGRFDSFDISQDFYWSGRVSSFRKIAISHLYAATNPTFYIHEGNHHVSRELNEGLEDENLGLTLLHLPVRSAERLKYRISNAQRLTLSKHNRLKGEGIHPEKILKLIRDGLASDAGLNAIAANYSVHDDNIDSLDPKELDWPSKRLPAHIAKSTPVVACSRDLTRTLLDDAQLDWRKLTFVKGSAVKAQLEGSNVTIIPQPITGQGSLVRGKYKKLNSYNPAIPSALDVGLLIDSVVVSFLEIRSFNFSAWSELIPALFCIFSILRPRRFVELGVQDGVSFFAGCQVADFLGLDTECVAIDSWFGDPHTGLHSSEVFERFRANMKEFHPSQHYIQAHFKDASQCFEEESIDLLHIDGYHSYKAVREDFEMWLAKMSQIGVIMLHDINEHENGFGVWRFWEELKAKYPTFSLLHSHGLGILYTGVQSNSILDLFALLQNNPSYATLVRQYLGAMGKSIGKNRPPNRQGANPEWSLNRRLPEVQVSVNHRVLEQQVAHHSLLRLWSQKFAEKQALNNSDLSIFAGLLRLQTILRRRKAYKTIKESGLFDVDYYLSTYDDVQRSGLDPIAHYVCHGAAELRNPSAAFNTAGYLLKNEDVLRAWVNPLEHYIVCGKQENRTC